MIFKGLIGAKPPPLKRNPGKERKLTEKIGQARLTGTDDSMNKKMTIKEDVTHI